MEKNKTCGGKFSSTSFLWATLVSLSSDTGNLLEGISLQLSKENCRKVLSKEAQKYRKHSGFSSDTYMKRMICRNAFDWWEGFLATLFM